MAKKMFLVWFSLMLAAGECLGMTVQERGYIPGVPFGARARSFMHAIALSPDEGTLYAAYWTSDSPEAVMAYSTSDWSHQVVFTYGTCHGGVVPSPDGRYVYATTYYQGGIARYDTQSHQVVHLGLGSWGVILSGTPDGNSLLATYNEWSSAPQCAASLALVNVSGGAFQVISRLPLNGPSQLHGRGPVTYSADGRRVYLVTGQSTTSNPRVLEVSFDGALALERSLVLPFTDPPTNVVRVADKLYVGSTLQPALIEIGLATFLPTGREFALDQAPFTLGVHPDGRHIFVLHDAGALSVIDAATGERECYVTDLPPRPVDIEFTADGRRAFVLQMDPSGETGGIVDLEVLVGTEVEAEVDLKPDTLNPRSRGRYVTAYTELPDGYDVADIDVGSVYLAVEGNETLVPAEPRPIAIGDYDNDGVPDLMVKFDRQAVQALLTPGETAALYVGGVLTDGTEFLGSDTVRVLGMVDSSALTFLGQLAQANETACQAVQALLDTLTSSGRGRGTSGEARRVLRLLDALLRRSPEAGVGAALTEVRQALSDLAADGAGPSGKIGISEVQLYSQARYVANCFAVLGDCYDFERGAWLRIRRGPSTDLDLTEAYGALDVVQAQIGLLSDALDDFRTLAGALPDPQRAQQLTALADDVQALLLGLADYAAAERAYVDSW